MMTLLLCATMFAQKSKPIDKSLIGVNARYFRTHGSVDRSTLLSVGFLGVLSRDLKRNTSLVFAISRFDDHDECEPEFRFVAITDGKPALSPGDTVRWRIGDTVVESEPAEAIDDNTVAVVFSRDQIATLFGRGRLGVTIDLAGTEIFLNRESLESVRVLLDAHADTSAFLELERIIRIESVGDDAAKGTVVYQKFDQYRRKQKRLKR